MSTVTEQFDRGDCGKSLTTAYLLLIFLGIFGAHRFYVAKPGGVAMAGLFIISTGFIFAMVGYLGLLLLLLWIITDAFEIPHWVRECNLQLPKA